MASNSFHPPINLPPNLSLPSDDPPPYSENPFVDPPVAVVGGENGYERYISSSILQFFGINLMSSWVHTVLLLDFIILNGGPASLFYGCLLSIFGVTAIGLSLAEMSSMAPAVAGQYRWVMAFSPVFPAFFGFITAWIQLLASLLSALSTFALLTRTVLRLFYLHMPEVSPEGWHATLMMLFSLPVLALVTLYFPKWVHAKQAVSFSAFGMVSLMVFILILVVASATNALDAPFGVLYKGKSGWNDGFICWGLGLVGVLQPLLGFDGVLSMTHETKEPLEAMPYAILFAIYINLVHLFLLVVPITIAMQGKPLSTNGDPFFQLLERATRSPPFTTFIFVGMCFVLMASLLNRITVVSRLTQFLAQDEALPWSSALAKIHQHPEGPTNSLFASIGVLTIFSIIPLFSFDVLSSAITLPLLFFIVSYLPPIFFSLLGRLTQSESQYGSFKLGRWGVPFNIFAIIFCVFLIPFALLPVRLPVSWAAMNYGGMFLGLFLLLGPLAWMFESRKFATSAAIEEVEMTGVAAA